MKRSVSIVAIWLIASAAVGGGVVGFKEVGLSEIRDIFKNQIPDGPWTFLQAPRTGLGVGTVYTIVDGVTVFYSRPEDCFAKELLEKAQDKMVVASRDITGKVDWSIGLRVANAGPITEEINAEFKKHRASQMKFKIGRLKRDFLTIKDLKDAINKQIDVDCKKVLTESKPERWIILETLSTDEFALEFVDDRGKNIALPFNLLKKIFPSFKYDSGDTVKGELKFSDQSYIVAIKAVRVRHPSRYAGGDLDVTYVKPDEFYRTENLPRN